MPIPIDDRTEWIEPDGLGGFASGTTAGIRTRRYHALLLASATPPTNRFVLVNGVEAWLETPAGTFPLSSQKYLPGIVHPPALLSIAAFEAEPWPARVFRLEDGTQVRAEMLVPRGMAAAVLSWKLQKRGPGGVAGVGGVGGVGGGWAKLCVRPLLSGRDFHALHRENGEFRFDPEIKGELVAWRMYPGVPGVLARSNGRYRHAPEWYRDFLYDQERARGQDCVEDLASPGVFEFDLDAAGTAEALLCFAATGIGAAEGGGAAEFLKGPAPAASVVNQWRDAERARRAGFPTALARAGDAYIVQRGAAGKTIIAGYPWFADWGRDTFISLRGLCLATGRLAEAGAILREWAGVVSEGMLPNRFPDRGGDPEYNAVDASLWYVVAVGEYLRSTGSAADAAELATLRRAVVSIATGYSKGTRYGIREDADGLLAAGVPGVQLTWMDAKCGETVFTPRIGKPVEVQALWVNALRVAAVLDPGGDWAAKADRASRAFEERFWNEARGCLFDVVDADHEPGRCDSALRPNQLFAVGGLPITLVRGERARRIVDTVEGGLMTPMGPRSLGPLEAGYCPRYEGDVWRRDSAYHQGTVWPWLLGAFVEAWVRVRGGTDEAKIDARRRFVAPLMDRIPTGVAGGVGHLAEIADAEPPHAWRGCPFQAWSVAELLRLERSVLATGDTPASSQKAATGRRRGGDKGGGITT